MKLTIEEVESRLEESLEKCNALLPLVPKGYRVQVTLLDQNERKKRRSASAETWSPESDLIQISFEREDGSGEIVAIESAAPVLNPIANPNPNPQSMVSD